MKIKVTNALILYNLGQGDKLSTQKMLIYPISPENLLSGTQNVQKVYYSKLKSSTVIFVSMEISLFI